MVSVDDTLDFLEEQLHNSGNFTDILRDDPHCEQPLRERPIRTITASIEPAFSGEPRREIILQYHPPQPTTATTTNHERRVRTAHQQGAFLLDIFGYETSNTPFFTRNGEYRSSSRSTFVNGKRLHKESTRELLRLKTLEKRASILSGGYVTYFNHKAMSLDTYHMDKVVRDYRDRPSSSLPAYLRKASYETRHLIAKPTLVQQARNPTLYPFCHTYDIKPMVSRNNLMPMDLYHPSDEILNHYTQTLRQWEHIARKQNNVTYETAIEEQLALMSSG